MRFSEARAKSRLFPPSLDLASFRLQRLCAMSSNFSEAIASMHLGNDKGSAQAGGQTPGSASSVESSYTRRGQTESDAEIRDGFAAVRDAASRNRRLETDVLSSSPRHAAASAIGGAGAGFAVPLPVRRRRESRSTEQEGDELARELNEEARTRHASSDGDASGSGTRTPLPDTSKFASSSSRHLSSS